MVADHQGRQYRRASELKTLPVCAQAQQADEMGNKIGPEFVALMDGRQDMNPASKEALEVGCTHQALDKL